MVSVALTIVLALLAAAMTGVLFKLVDDFDAKAKRNNPDDDPLSGGFIDRESYLTKFGCRERFEMIRDACKWAIYFVSFSAVVFGLMNLAGQWGWVLLDVGFLSLVVATYPFALLPRKLRKSILNEKVLKLGPNVPGFTITVGDI